MVCKLLMDGLFKFDCECGSWNGVIDKIVLNVDWGVVLVEVELLSDL